MIRRMFLSKRFRAGVAGLVVGSVALSGCAHDSNSMFAKVWPFGKDEDKTAVSSSEGETQIASAPSTPSAPTGEKPSVRERIGGRLAKLVGRDKDEFPQDPFMGEYNQGTKQAVAQTPAGNSGDIQTVSGRTQATEANRAQSQPSPQVEGEPVQPQPGQANQFAAGFGQRAHAIAGTSAGQQQPTANNISQSRIDELRASLRREMLGNDAAAPPETGGLGAAGTNPFANTQPQIENIHRPIPDQPTNDFAQSESAPSGVVVGDFGGPEPAQNEFERTPSSADTNNPFEDPRLLNLARQQSTQTTQQPAIQPQPNLSQNSGFAQRAFEDGFGHGGQVARKPLPQPSPNLTDAIRSDDGFAHGRAALRSTNFQPPETLDAPVPNTGAAEKEDGLYNQIMESDEVPSGKFYGPRDFDSVQANRSVDLRHKVDPASRDLAPGCQSASTGFQVIQQASNEVPAVTSNQPIVLPQVTTPPTGLTDASTQGPSLGSGDLGGTVPGGLNGPLMITPEAPANEPAESVASSNTVEIPQSPVQGIEWAGDEFVVDKAAGEEENQWPMIVMLAAGLAAVVGFMIRRSNAKPDPTQGLRIVQGDDSDRKAA